MFDSRTFVLLAAFATLLSAVPCARADFNETATLKKAVPKLGDRFGASMQVSGNRAIVGAYLDEGPGFAGAAHVLERDAFGLWSTSAKLVASDAHLGDQFGYSVGLSGDRAIAGAWNHDDNGLKTGAAYIYERNASGSWGQAAKLLASDPFWESQFGVCVAIDGDRAVVGANFVDDRGAVYVFERAANGVWSQVAKLQSQDVVQSSVGCSVALKGDRIIAGACVDPDFGDQAGAVYIFDRGANGIWSQSAKLHAADGAAHDMFGYRVDVDGDRVLVSAIGDGDLGTLSGSCYVFERGFGGLWLQKAKLLSPNGVAGALFGCAIELDAERAFIGASQLHTPWIGHAYVWQRDPSGVWHQTVALESLEPEVQAGFGKSVAFAGEQLLVGAPEDDGDTGAVHVFQSCGGSNFAYGAGCPGAGGFTPVLSTQGCLEHGGYATLKLNGALGSSFAILLFGTGTGTASLGGGCSLSIMPLLPLQLIVPVSNGGPGNGTMSLTSGIPAGPVSSLTFTMQALVIDPSTAIGVNASNALSITID